MGRLIGTFLVPTFLVHFSFFTSSQHKPRHGTTQLLILCSALLRVSPRKRCCEFFHKTKFFQHHFYTKDYFILILFKDKSKTKNTHSENMWIKFTFNSIKVNAYWRQYKKETLDMPIHTKNRNKFTCCFLFILSEKAINN